MSGRAWLARGAGHCIRGGPTTIARAGSRALPRSPRSVSAADAFSKDAFVLECRTMPQPLRLYLSAAIANGPLNSAARGLSGRACSSPAGVHARVPHADLPRAIYERCIEEMERCDAALFKLTRSASTARKRGRLARREEEAAHRGICQKSARFLQHWMVKGNSRSRGVSRDPLFDAW